MPNPITLPIGPGIAFKFGSTVYKLSDHNRSELSITPERLENKKRMADGTLRTYVVATKRNFKTSWEWLPRDNNQTVDGFLGGKEIVQWYFDKLGSFEIVLTNGKNETETVLVMFDSFDWKITKRSKYTDFYDIDMSLSEV